MMNINKNKILINVNEKCKLEKDIMQSANKHKQ